MKAQRIVLTVFLAALAVVAGCAPQAPQQTQNQPQTLEVLQIGFIGPLTGDAASYGLSIKKGIELAKKELGRTDIEIIYEDTKCDGKEAVSGITKLATVDSVEAVIGDVCSGATLPAVPIAEQNEVVLLSASATSPKITDAGDYVFRVVPSDALQGDFIAELIAKTGAKKLAILHSNEEYGLGLATVLEKKFTELGGAIATRETFERTSTDMRTQITKVKSKAPDAVFFTSNSPDGAAAGLKQMKELGLNIPVFSSEALKSPDIIASAGDAAEGLVVSAVSFGTTEFTAKHKAEYNEDPGPFAAQGYDAFVALTKALDTGARSGKDIKDALYKVNFDGASGHIAFDTNGDVAGNYDVFKVENGTFVAWVPEEEQTE